jgi:hypothetical protein
LDLDGEGADVAEAWDAGLWWISAGGILEMGWMCMSHAIGWYAGLGRIAQEGREGLASSLINCHSVVELAFVSNISVAPLRQTGL